MIKRVTFQALRQTALAATAIATILIAAVPAKAQLAQPATTGQTETRSPRGNFLSAFEGFRKRLDEASKGVSDATRTLGDITKMTVDNKRADLTDLREKLLGLSKQMESEGALAQAIDQFDSWVVANRKRIDIRRGDLGNQSNVEDLLKTYDQFGKDIGRARELLNSYKIGVIALLQELTASEALAAEYLLAEEAGKAIETLQAALGTVNATMEAFRAKLHEFGLNGRSS
jgi:hypothetical protein